MIQHNGTVARVRSLDGIQGWLITVGFVVAAVALPALCHLGGLPVRLLLPMHWPVLLIGMLYGWRGGLAVGALAPLSNYAVTGYPLPPVLPAMTVELATYGFVAGWLRERLGWNSFASVAGAIVAGRVAFIATIWLTAGYPGAFGTYLQAAMIPGLVAGALQVGVLGWVGLKASER